MRRLYTAREAKEANRKAPRERKGESQYYKQYKKDLFWSSCLLPWSAHFENNVFC